MTTFIGIDWGEKHHHVHILNAHGATVAQFMIPHSLAGVEAFEQQRTKLGLPPTDCAIALETAYNLLVDFCWDHQYPLYVIAPHITHSRRASYRASRAHDDTSDAFLLADLLRTDRDRFLPWQPDGALVRQLRVQLESIAQLTHTIVAYHNRLRAVLLRYYPTALGLFQDLHSQISLRFLLHYPTPQAAQALSYPEFVSFCKAQRYTWDKLLPEHFAYLQRPALTADPVVVQACQAETVFLAEVLLNLVQRKEALLRTVQQSFQEHPDSYIYSSLPAAGDLLAPQLLVMFGDRRERYPDPAIIQALAGTCPVTHRSGKSRQVRFRHACDHAYRQTAQQFAQASVRQADWAAAYYAQCRARGHTKSHAYRCLANRWLTIIWTLWQRREAYNETYHTQQIRQHRRPA